ncbi:MAG: error-prone DNA polymerase [Proteobacteria bacterium]|nr:error-prone DNA polymerase [Pseudomonadota bacterium]
MPPDYAELGCQSHFSFLVGASAPAELVARAQQLGYRALAVTDTCSLAGVVRAHVAAKAAGLHLLVGASFEAGGALPLHLTVLAETAAGYAALCRRITLLRRRAPKGSYSATVADLTELPGCLAIATPPRGQGAAPAHAAARWLAAHWRGCGWLGVTHEGRLDDAQALHHARQAAAHHGVPLTAMGHAQMHARSRKPLHDVLTATRLGRPLAACGSALAANAERHLRRRERLAELFEPDLLAATVHIAARCTFSLDALRYQYPHEVVPAGHTPTSWLRTVTWQGAARRWPQGVAARERRQIEHELALIADMGYEPYFLTVYDIVAFARGQGILCQGRGSAANSAVCFCLGITEVDPAQTTLLFERFISRERGEPPDIDVDFEHQRREEVIQHLYATYGRDRAALTATVIRYRSRSAVRDVGKALGLAPAALATLTPSRHDDGLLPDERLTAAGLDPHSPTAHQLRTLVRQLLGTPRHLSQHTGGFVLTHTPLAELVPIENAAMPGRTVIEWDKDDLDAMGFMKVDVLALGMLSAIRRALALIPNGPACLADIPQDDGPTYDMVCAADTVGVFQIESRAQMSMLPRLRPRTWYDLVIEVALVRPGPIQGGAVHPYLQRRQGLEPVTYPSDALREALGRTLGVPVFQEQCMQIAILAAGFTASEADGLRRAMAAWRHEGSLHVWERRLKDGLRAHGYSDEFAHNLYEQIKGFSSYGFPESHAASFATLVYASAWIKCHHPAVFLVALLNSQPLGFYTPSQLVQDAQRHGVLVQPVDIAHSTWAARLEGAAVRLGFALVDGLGQAAAQRVQAARDQAPFTSVGDLTRRAALGTREVQALAAADALTPLAGHRRQQVWQAAGQQHTPALLRTAPVREPALHLAPAPEGEAVTWDYAATGLTLRSHPMALLRPHFTDCLTAEQLHQQPDRRLVRTAGLVTLRQRPPTAKGVMFITLEDETGVTQVVVWPRLRERLAGVWRGRLLTVRGVWQRQQGACNLIAGYARDGSGWLGELGVQSRDFF